MYAWYLILLLFTTWYLVLQVVAHTRKKIPYTHTISIITLWCLSKLCSNHPLGIILSNYGYIVSVVSHSAFAWVSKILDIFCLLYFDSFLSGINLDIVCTREKQVLLYPSKVFVPKLNLFFFA
jgi:hypothetical protein